MESSQVSWFVIEDEMLVPSKDYYSGSYYPEQTMTVQLQVWNNRWGQTPIENVSNAILALYFDTVEDSFLLNLCSVKIGSGEFQTLNTEGLTKGTIALGSLSGEANDGSSYAINNYKNVIIKFGPVPKNLKNGLKNLFLDIEADQVEEGGV